MNGRITPLNTRRPSDKGPVVYWMSRDQRVDDNWALLYARQEAIARHTGLGVLFVYDDSFPRATRDHFRFMLMGILETQRKLKGKGIPLFFLKGKPRTTASRFLETEAVSLLVTDFSPTRNALTTRETIARDTATEVHEVDAHNIIPCRTVSAKQEYAAYTIRPKIHGLLPEYLTPIPRLMTYGQAWKWKTRPSRPEDIAQAIPDGTPGARFPVPGGDAANIRLAAFTESKLDRYHHDRNDPNKEGQSGLSPYLHFGQLSAQRVALAVGSSRASWKSKEVFLEELIVRRELADNFCLHNSAYDTIEGSPSWARQTLEKHEGDRRDYEYSLEEFREALTHDPLWNAAQNQMCQTGAMHGYMRMYWAKKILEWTGSPTQAVSIAVSLNDAHSLDGRDPNGYAGVLWAICGVHDRPWTERPVYGMIRYMNASGCARKFDTARYIRTWTRPQH